MPAWVRLQQHQQQYQQHMARLPVSRVSWLVNSGAGRELCGVCHDCVPRL
jgi:hypothetical protein